MPIKTSLTANEIQVMIDRASCLRDKVIVSFYGDSVPCYSPVVIKREVGNSREIDIIGFEELWSLVPEPTIKFASGEEIKILASPIWILDYTPRHGTFTELKFLLRHPYQGSLLKINTHTAIVEVSPNHSIFAGETCNGLRLKDARDIEVGYYLSQLDWPKVREGSMAAWSIGGKELAWLYGFFYAEGSAYISEGLSHSKSGNFIRRYNISLSNVQKTLLLNAEEIFFQFFAKKMSWSEHHGCHKINCGCPKGLFDFFQNQFYTPDGLKRVPRIILNAPRKIKLAFLEGYNLGDGSQNSANRLTSFTTNSPVGAMGLLWLAVTTGHTKYALNIREDKPMITEARFRAGTQRKELKRVKKIIETKYKGYLYDAGTKSNTFITGVGLTRVHNTGCRVSELLKIKVENVDLENGEVLIPHLKRGIHKRCPSCGTVAGRSTPFCSHCGHNLSKVVAEGIEERSRLIDIGAVTCSILQQYIKGMKPDEYIIKITRQRIYYIIRDLAKVIGIKGKVMLNPETGKRHYVHPHNFRDSLAIAWLDYAGDDVGKQKALQEHLGHKMFETTMRYHKLTPARVKKVSGEVRRLRFQEVPV